MPATSLFKSLLAMTPAKRTAIGGGLGLLGSQVENQTLLGDYDPSVKAMNSTLGAATGGLAALAGMSHPEKALAVLASWPLKQMALTGLGTGKKYVDIQQPIAEKNLETARTALDTAKLEGAAARHISTSDIARLGLAGAGLAGAGGLGYYLYNTLGPGKKKTSPRVTVTLDGKNKGETQVEGDMDTLDLSKRLHSQLRRDAKRKLREETNRNTHHEGHDHPRRDEAHPQREEAPPVHGIVREDPNPSTMSNIMNLLRN